MSETNSCHYLSVHLNPAEAKINFISVTLTCFLLGADLLTTIPLKTFFLLDIFFLKNILCIMFFLSLSF